MRTRCWTINRVGVVVPGIKLSKDYQIVLGRPAPGRKTVRIPVDMVSPDIRAAVGVWSLAAIDSPLGTVLVHVMPQCGQRGKWNWSFNGRSVVVASYPSDSNKQNGGTEMLVAVWPGTTLVIEPQESGRKRTMSIYKVLWSTDQLIEIDPACEEVARNLRIALGQLITN